MIILAAATYNEIGISAEWLKNNQLDNIDVLITGIGSAAAAWALTRCVFEKKPRLIIQAGIAGSFTEELTPGTITFVHEECFADLGAIEEDGLTDIFDLGLTGVDEPPFEQRLLVNKSIERWKRYGFPFYRGATVNNISSTQQQTERIRNKYNPGIESMEGAALHYVCLRENIPFIQLRAISNYAGERNKEKWKLKKSVVNLNMALKKIISDTE